MNKKGNMKTFTEALLAVISVVTLLFTIYSGIVVWNSINPEQKSVETRDLERIISELKELKNIDDNIEVPVFSKDGILKIIPADEIKYFDGCRLDNCLCINKNANSYVCKGFNLKKDYGVDKVILSYGGGDILLDGTVLLIRTNDAMVKISSVNNIINTKDADDGNANIPKI